MGLFSKLLNSKENKDEEFITLIRALDNGEEWANKRINEMWDNNDSSLISRMNKARIQIYNQAAQQGDVQAQYWMGYSLQETNIEESLKWLIPLAEQGHIDAMIAIALGYTEFGGYGVDPKQVKYWYQKAAEAGDAKAQARIGLEYVAEGNNEDALKWYRLSAEQGCVQGYIGVAKCYANIREHLFSQGGFSDQEQRKAEEEKYNKLIEEAYISAANGARNDDESCEAFSGLGHFYYLSSLGGETTEDIPKRAAYFLYLAYLCGNKFELKWFDEIVSKYELKVDMNNIEEWADSENLFG